MVRMFAAVILLVASFAAAPSSAQRFQAGDASLIAPAEAALRQLTSLQADFTFQNVAQFNTGRLYVDRPNRKMRMEFDPPLGHLLIANGARVDFIGGDGTVVNTGTQSTPLGLIFRQNPTLSGPVKVLEIATKGNSVYFAVTQRDDPDAGKVILHFNRAQPYWLLHGWGFIDPKGRYTKTVISNVRNGVRLSPALFRRPGQP